MERSTVDRVPTLISNGNLAANAVAYLPGSSGGWQDRFGNTMLIRYVEAYVWADKAGTLVLEESEDKSSVSTTSTTSVTASTSTRVAWTQLSKRYWRWKYTNGANAQTEFRLYENKTPNLQNVVSYALFNGVPVAVKASASDGTIATSTTATATFNDKFEQVITGLFDFKTPVAKTSGQTYDNPHVVKAKSVATFDAPSTFVSEASTAAYALMATQDGSTTNHGGGTSVNTYYPQALYSFDLLTATKRLLGVNSNITVSDLESALKKITITWVGYGSGASGGVATAGATLKIYNDAGTAWAAVNTNVTSSPSSISQAYTTSLANYVDANGYVHFLAHATNASDGVVASTIYTDYVKVDVEVVGAYLQAAMVGKDAQGLTRVARLDAVGQQHLADKHDILITRQLDYAGKTATQTYDVPHVAKYISGGAATFGAPSAFSSERSTGDYVQLATQDGTSNAATTSTNTNYAQSLFSFDLLTAAKRSPGIPQNWTVTDLTANIKALSISWVGYGVGVNAGAPTNGATMKVWTPGTATWTAGTTNSATSPSALSLSPSTPSTYIDAQGYTHVLAHSTYPSDGVNPSTIYTDYIRVEMTLVGQALNDQATQNVQDDNLGQTTVTAGATTAVASNVDLMRCTDFVIAMNASASHTYSVLGDWVGKDNVVLNATADRATLIASAAQLKKMSAKTAVLAPRITVLVNNADASDRTYYPRIIRLGVKGARQS